MDATPAGSASEPNAPDVAAIVTAHNHAIFKLGMTEYDVAPKGVKIHKIDDATALSLALAIIDAAMKNDLPVPYLMACIAVESVFDTLCENGNFSFPTHTGSNPEKAPEGFDMGACQLKLRYLIGAVPGLINVDEARAFAFDVNRAVPYMGAQMQALLQYADRAIANAGPKLPALRNRFYAATAGYNFGRSGLLHLLQIATSPVQHCEQVVKLETAFAKQLGATSVFGDLTQNA